MNLFNNNKRELRIIDLSIANNFVDKFHRHNNAVVGHIFSIGLFEHGNLIGVAICGRPISRHLDNGKTIEITRVCTNGERNANSQLYSYCKKLATAKGFNKVITYTLQSESGSSLKAVNAKIETDVIHCRDWNDSKNVKRAKNTISLAPKYRWAL